jgi:pantetheine-phosphate adenylyltransferase
MGQLLQNRVEPKFYCNEDSNFLSTCPAVCAHFCILLKRNILRHINNRSLAVKRAYFLTNDKKEDNPVKKSIYALSADPITLGHLNIIDRGLEVFDHILVGIGINPQKKYTFTLEKRESLTRDVLKKYGDRVSVKSYSGLLADFAYENEIKTIIRGARNSVDFDFERMLSDINQGFHMGIDTYILVADQALSHISSSTAKELQKNQAKNVRDYVPLIVKQALEIEISKQYLIGVTGLIGSGKSFITKRLIKESKEYSSTSDMNKIPIHSIDMDELGRYILKESNEPIHISIRNKIVKEFGKDLIINNMVDVNHLLTLMFDDPDAVSIRSIFEGIMEEPMTHLFRKRLSGLQGIILINSALFVESNICDLVNNNILYISCPEPIRMERLKGRGYTDQQIRNRVRAQLTEQEKISKIEQLIKNQDCGQLISYNNYKQDVDISDLYYTIISNCGGLPKL